MKPKQISHISLAIIIALVSLTFLTGVMQTFIHARAAISPTGTPASQVVNALAATPTVQRTPVPKSADTTGVIALATVIVAIILVGATWGRWKPKVKNQAGK